MIRLSVFPRGVSVELLGALVDAGGDVAGLLVNARPRLLGLLTSLKARGLVFEYRSNTDVTWTAHPFLRETFRELLGLPCGAVVRRCRPISDFRPGETSDGQAERLPYARPVRSALSRRLVSRDGRKMPSACSCRAWISRRSSTTGSINGAIGFWQPSTRLGGRRISSELSSQLPGQRWLPASHSWRNGSGVSRRPWRSGRLMTPGQSIWATCPKFHLGSRSQVN